MLGAWAALTPRPAFPGWKARSLTHSLSGCPSVPTACLRPAQQKAAEYASVGLQLRAVATQRGHWCLASTGDEAGVTQALPRDLPRQCQPGLPGQQLLGHKLFLDHLLGTLF